jgi:hypothetical protein
MTLTTHRYESTPMPFPSFPSTVDAVLAACAAPQIHTGGVQTHLQAPQGPYVPTHVVVSRGVWVGDGPPQTFQVRETLCVRVWGVTNPDQWYPPIPFTGDTLLDGVRHWAASSLHRITEVLTPRGWVAIDRL